MKWQNLSTFEGRRTLSGGVISRRQAMDSAGLAFLGLLTGSALGRARASKSNTDAPDRKPRQRPQEIERLKADAERMRNATPDERWQIIMEQRVRAHQRAIEEFRERLGLSEKEWPVVKLRIEKVYNLVHPLPEIGRIGAAPRTEEEQRRRELRELLRNAEAPADQIKARLGALRAAREKARRELAKARQDLRRLMTLRQEAELVLSGLLD